MDRGIRWLVTAFVLLMVLGAGSLPAMAVPQMSPERQGTSVHIAQWGETLDIIARRYGVTVSAIVEANGLWNPDYVYAGQILVIPLGGPAPPPSGPTTTYVVQRGDRLQSIAARYGTTVSELARLNSILNPDLIYVGQVLKVPGPGAPAPPPTACTYWVKAGDTLSRIAVQYQTTVWAITIANNLANPSFIWVGQQLIIPGCGTTPPGCQPQGSPTPSTVPVGAYEFQLVREPDDRPCQPGVCIPEVTGVVQDAAGNPLSNFTWVWIKLVSGKQGTMYCRTGDPSLSLQEGLFKFISQNGDVFGEYTLTVVRSQEDPTPLSPTYDLEMNSHENAGQQSNITFKRNY